MQQEFINVFSQVQDMTYEISGSKGWNEKGRSEGESIALMHSELSEALEAIRDGNPASNKIPNFSCVEEEMADVVIRVMNYAKAHDLRLAEAIIAKSEFNKNRPIRHGGKVF